MLTGEIVLLGDGGPQLSSGAVTLLLGLVVVGGALAVVNAKNSHRRKGGFRGLGNAMIQLWGGGKRRRRRSRRH